MKPPLIVNEHGCIDVYKNIEEMLRSLEAIDVANGEYQVFDSTGRQVFLSAKVPESILGRFVCDGEIMIESIEEEPSLIYEFRALLVKTIKRKQGAVNLSQSLDDLIRLVSDNQP